MSHHGYGEMMIHHPYHRDACLKYIEQMLAEEDDRIDTSSFFGAANASTLHAMEQSFTEALHNNHNNSDGDNASRDEANASSKSKCTTIHFRGAMEEARRFLPSEGVAPLEEGIWSCEMEPTQEEDEVLEMFERLFLGPANQGKLPLARAISQNQTPRAALGRSTHGVIDLESLLLGCARAAATNDYKVVEESLSLIRKHSSPTGDGTQRLAHYFAHALNVRFFGTGAQLYNAINTELLSSAVDIMKAIRSFVSVCPFQVIGFYFTMHHIANVAAVKEAGVHIIDFGIFTGLHTMTIISQLATRPGGPPPKIRVTGIEHSQWGFSAAGMVEQTGRRLAKCCKKYSVPFEFNGIVQRWETIEIEDLKIEKDEANVVLCMLRSENLLDEVVGLNNPRAIVLNLIRRMNPDIFVHFISNGAHNAAFFFSRFRLALYHYATLFDMMDTNLSRESEDRLMFERCFLGRNLLNIVGCEGVERVERAETYRQWQARVKRAGFRQLRVDRELLRTLKAKVKAGYHKDFGVDEDGDRIVQGWKGKILCAICCWVPIQQCNA